MLASITHDTESGTWETGHARVQRSSNILCCGPGGEFEEKWSFLPTYLTCTFVLKKKNSGPYFIPCAICLFTAKKKERKTNRPSLPAIQQLSSFLSYHHPPAPRRAAQTVIDLAWSLPPRPSSSSASHSRLSHSSTTTGYEHEAGRSS